MKIGQAVFQDYQGIRRFGVVESVKKHDDGWSYAKIKWFDDYKYDAAMQALTELRAGKDFVKRTYRVDEVRQIDAAKEAATLNKILQYQAGV